MALYTNDSKERVRDAVDMVDLVSSRTELRKAGANRFTGLCPFHDERTPSFGINPGEKVYYCFGCQASGDAFTFVMETEGVDFKGALELLADRYKIALELEDEDPRAAEQRQRRERLLELLERTATYYARQLWESKEAQRAREYLQERGLQEATLREFRVGYAPSAWDTVLKATIRAGFKATELWDAGLLQSNEKTGRKYDRFRSQIIFPLADSRGRVRGFAGRSLAPDDERRGPKYVNSPESALFEKRKQVFGADLARAAAAKAGTVIVAEGYTDVIALHQIGLRNSIAIMGTSLTGDQVVEIARLAPVALLALDPDNAGQEAGLRAHPLVIAQRQAAERRLSLRVIPLPSGADPADLIKFRGGDQMRLLCEKAVPYVLFQANRALERADLSTTEGKSAAFSDLQTLIGTLRPDQLVEREEILRVAADRMRLSAELVASLISRRHQSGTQRPGLGEFAGNFSGGPGDQSAWGKLSRQEKQERTFLELCIALPGLGAPALAELDLEADLATPVLRRAAVHLREHLAAPTDALDGDEELTALVRALAVRAAGMERASPAQFRVERLQLELHRIEREIAAARARDEPMTELARRRGATQAKIGRAMEQVMEEGASRG